MRLALWGAGNTLSKCIDEINHELHTVIFLIDSFLSCREKWGIPVKHFKDVDIDSVDAIIITTKFYGDVLNTIQSEFPQLQIPVFENLDKFLAFEYVNILHKELLDNPLYKILEAQHFQYETDKRLQYLDIYDRYFSKFRGTDLVFLEIGVYKGGSLKLWKEYFGNKAKIIGIDINPDCKKYRDEQIEIEIGMQESKYFWDYIKRKYPHVDIVLDDGGHTMKQQISTLTEMFPHLDNNGVYMCEDVFTSYWNQWGGGYKNESTFIEFVKNMIDHMNLKFAPTEPFWINHYVENVKSICFHQGIVVIEKDRISKKIDNTLLR